jgi:hypothetical protein
VCNTPELGHPSGIVCRLETSAVWGNKLKIVSGRSDRGPWEIRESWATFGPFGFLSALLIVCAVLHALVDAVAVA